MKIGLLSDTHGYLDPAIPGHFKDCDEIWHAGDFGNPGIITALEELKPFRGVYGNIDEPGIRHIAPENIRFQCEGLEVLMTHIAGTPPRYTPRVKKLLDTAPADILVCGHSHLLLVKKDVARNLLYLNPVAAGRHGFHHMRTVLRFEITGRALKNMEVIELGPRSAIQQ